MAETSSRPPLDSLVVALDGPASSGKSTVGAAAARELGLRFADTGLLYRAVTALALRERVAVDDPARLVGLVDRIALADDGDARLTRVLLDGVDATDEAQGRLVDAAVSAVARIPEVRDALLPRQRELAADGGIVVAGRDIGTVVLPDADLKLFLDASVDERAERRILERGLDPSSPDAAAVRDALHARDAQDSSRAVAPLRSADDALILHTDGHALEDTVSRVVDAVRAAAPKATATGATARNRPPSEARSHVDRAPTPPAEHSLANDQTMLIRMVALLSRIGSRLVARVEFEGLDRIPRSGAVILAVNHASNLDPFVVGAWATTVLGRRRIHWLGKRELFDWPVLGWIAARGGVHPVDRSTADVEAYRLATRILDAGFVLLIFPEGTRSPTGALQEAKDGLAALALRTGAAIVPIGVNDSDAVWPKGRRLPRPFPRRTITVRVGSPFRTADVVPPGTDRRAAKAVATRAIMSRIAALVEPRQRGAYGEARPAR